MNKNQSQAGFTLIELCIVLVITSLMLVGAIQAYTIYNEKQKIERTNSLMSDINQAFNEFPDRYIPSTIVADADGRLTGTYFARLPRPAPLNGTSAGNNFNLEVASGDVNSAVASGNLIRVVGTGGVNVLIGKFPAGTLDISNDYMKDIHGNYLLYAVTEAATVDLKSAGAITVIEEGIDHREASPTIGQIVPYGAPHEYVQYAVISMGANGDGAYAFDGTRQFYNHDSNACPSNAVREGENCNLDDATFRASLLSNRDDNTSNNDYYDDTVLFKVSPISSSASSMDDVLVSAKEGEDFTTSGGPISGWNGAYGSKKYDILKDSTYAAFSWSCDTSSDIGCDTRQGRSGSEFLELKAGDSITHTNSKSNSLRLTDESGNIVDASSRQIDKEFIFSTNPSFSGDNGFSFNQYIGGDEMQGGYYSKNFRIYVEK